MRHGNRCAIALALTVALASGRGVSAHEVGTTRVAIAFGHDSTYEIDLTTDAAALLTRLELARHQPRTSPVSRAELQHALDGLCDEVPHHLSMSVDQVVGAPDAECRVDVPPTSGSDDVSVLGVTVILRGSVPPGATAFRWRYDLTFASYALSLKTASAATDQAVMLEGGQESEAMAIVRLPAPLTRTQVLLARAWFGFTRVLPYGVPHILFLLALIVTSDRKRTTFARCAALSAGECLAIKVILSRGLTISPSAYEPLMALSLCGVVVAALLAPPRRGLQTVVVFALGLPHGFRLAAALSNATLPPAPLAGGATAFIGGVLVSQLVVLGCLCLIVPVSTPSRSLCAEGRHPR